MALTETETKLYKLIGQIREKTDFKPLIALVLGSGLGDYARKLKVECEIGYDELEGFPVSTVEGHDGRYIFGYLGDIPVVCMKGRVHCYEGYEMKEVVLPIRLMAMMGAKVLFLTNAAGGVNPSFAAGDLMLIRDHISIFVPNPLIGQNPDTLGPRFPDMSCIYDQKYRDLIAEAAKENDIKLQQGIYTQLTGPSYESPAEVRLIKALGTDAVGMSTAVEAIAARHAGMKVCGISFITNPAAGLSDSPLNHEEVQENARKGAMRFETLVSESILRIAGTFRDDEK